MQVLPKVCRKMWVIICLLTVTQNLLHILQPCLFLISSGQDHRIPRMGSLPVSAAPDQVGGSRSSVALAREERASMARDSTKSPRDRGLGRTAIWGARCKPQRIWPATPVVCLMGGAQVALVPTLGVRGAALWVRSPPPTPFGCVEVPGNTPGSPRSRKERPGSKRWGPAPRAPGEWVPENVPEGAQSVRRPDGK